MNNSASADVVMPQQEVLQILAAIVSNSDDAIISKDTNGVITSWNRGAENIFGYSAQEAIGKAIHFLLPLERLEEEATILNKILKGERVEHIETERVCKGGRRITISVTISPIFDSQGEVIGASKIARDITSQKEMQQKLLEANKELIFNSKLIAEQIVELEKSIAKTRQTEDQMLVSLNLLSLARDNETGNHVIRTQHYVKVIATRLFAMGKYPNEINEQKIDLLFRAAPLHDIGKVGIPDSILQKPGKLDDEEWLVMKTHAAIGESVLSAANLQSQNEKTIIGTAIKIAGGHHEHWDGSGYPRGLVGKAIPIAARIMSIADVYDALISKRVYKQQWTHEQADHEIISMRGTKFDPVIVDAFIAEQNAFKEIAQQYQDE
jgi:PAS domain S-box-containing protein